MIATAGSCQAAASVAPLSFIVQVRVNKRKRTTQGTSSQKKATDLLAEYVDSLRAAGVAHS